ncbi:MAG: aspartate aminotransferase family protein, partial [Myxococcales bacterium]|nr:aspartate aminotransferase family protein [Myxococcales bacterium]
MEYLSENGLDPTSFPSVVKFETEVISMAAAHLGGDDAVVGNFTSGGTESCILAVKTARDYARAERGITEPEVILPTTAHAAFQKGCHYLGCKPVLVDVNTTTFEADVEKVREAITDNTILIVGSACSYAHGTVDPITEMAALAAENGILMHVDGCLGGFLLPFFKQLGVDVPPFDFSVPGVTSMSMDFHKYAFAAKGASSVLYKNKDLRRYQIYTCASWTGYSISNPTFQSSKSAGPLASAWAVLNFIGQDGYVAMAKKMLDGFNQLKSYVADHPDLEIMGRPRMNLLAFESSTVSLFEVADLMKARGWYIQPQLGYGGSKENIHINVNPNCVKWMDDMLKDLGECVEEAKSAKQSALATMVKAAFADLNPADMSPEIFSQMLGMAGMSGAEVPEKMAEINEVLNSLPTALRARLLTEFMNDLFVYEGSK